jgi:hypothetical protein
MVTARLILTICLGILSIANCGVVGAKQARVSLKGTLVANGKTIELPYVYAYAKKEGFYDKSDPAWELIFVQHPLNERDVDNLPMASTYIRLGIIEATEIDDKPQIRVDYQELRLFPDKGESLTPCNYPKIEISSAGPDRLTGRVYFTEMQESFGTTFKYDYTFDVLLYDLGASIGELLPVGGGAPGEAYLAWVTAIRTGDKQKIKSLLPAEQGVMVDAPAFTKDLKFIQKITPANVKIVRGSNNGETAVLEVAGTVAGEEMMGKITMKNLGGKWINTRARW